MTLSDINFKELETKGFLIIPNFLNSDEVAELLDVYNSVITKYNTVGAKNKNYSVLRGTNPESVKIKSLNLLKLINSETNLKTNMLTTNGADYLDSKLIKFGWHQDHESYYKWQNAYNDLNFWIPIIKPKSTESGLHLVPFDKIKDIAPEITEQHIVGKGAKKFTTIINKTVMQDDETGDVLELDFNLELIKETTNICPGDLLLIRGDTIHCSQSSLTHRASISFRAVNGNGIITKDKFLSGCIKKHTMIKNNPGGFSKILSCFEKSNTILIKDILGN